MYGAAVAAWCAVRMLQGSGAALPWGLPTGSIISRLWSEHNSEVDDLVLDLAHSGRVYAQIKHGLVAGPEFRKAVDQFVRQIKQSDFSCARDRLILVTDTTASGTIRIHLRRSLAWFQYRPSGTPRSEFPLGTSCSGALDLFLDAFESAWRIHSGGATPTEQDILNALSCTQVTVIDPLDGSEKDSCIEALQQFVSPAQARLAWDALTAICLDAGRQRRPIGSDIILDEFRRLGVELMGGPGHAPVKLGVCAAGVTAAAVTAWAAKSRYQRENYVERRAMREALKNFLGGSKRVLLVCGGAGQGKTTWCVHSCDGSFAPARLLLRGEDIEESDQSLFDTIERSLNSYQELKHGHRFTRTEFSLWLESTDMVVFVDGLDRTTASVRRKLYDWLSNTRARLQDLRLRMVLTTRPELEKSIADSIAMGALEPGKNVVTPGDYDELEAATAAQKLGRPDLAKYRHPGMMSFCSELGILDAGLMLSREEAVAAFLKQRLGQMTLQDGFLSEDMDDFVESLGRVVADSPDGLLSKQATKLLRSSHHQIYQAFRRENLISTLEDGARLEPDELAEHLGGRHLQIDKAMADIAEYLSYPLKLGALRSAIEQACAKDAAKSKGWIDHLMQEWIRTQNESMISVLCSIVQGHREIVPLREEVLRIAKSWKKENLFAFWGEGLELLNLLSDPRWAPEDRVTLLWALARNENGFDWRVKHWSTPRYAPNFHVTLWRQRMLTAIRVANVDGLKFLMRYFDSREELPETSEANLGDLAQGCFFLSADGLMVEAMRLLANDSRQSCKRLLEMLPRSYPLEVLEVLAIRPDFLDRDRLVELLSDTSRGGVLPLARELATRWLGGDPAFRGNRSLLRLLCAAGEVWAATELVRQGRLHREDVASLFYLTDLTIFIALLSDALALADFSDPEDEIVHGLEMALCSAQQVQPLTTLLAARCPDGAVPVGVALLLETMLNAYMHHDEPAVGLFELVRSAIRGSDTAARSVLLYACSGPTKDHELTTRGKELRMALLRCFHDFEAEPGLLRRMTQHLIERQHDNASCMELVLSLAEKHPALRLIDSVLLLHPSAIKEGHRLRSELERRAAAGTTD